MCNVYEPATEQYLRSEWKDYEDALRPYKVRVGPRDDGPVYHCKANRGRSVGHDSTRFTHAHSASETQKRGAAG